MILAWNINILEQNDTPSMDIPSFQESCQQPPNTRTYKVMNGVRNMISSTWKKVDVPQRIDHLKDQVCTSLDVTLLQQRLNSETNGKRPYQHQSEWKPESSDDGNLGYTEFGFLEKPVRALRRSFQCNDNL